MMGPGDDSARAMFRNEGCFAAATKKQVCLSSNMFVLPPTRLAEAVTLFRQLGVIQHEPCCQRLEHSRQPAGR